MPSASGHKLLFALFLFFIPFFTNGSVIISEIAWMGSDNGGSARQNANDEWIELYNNGDNLVDLSGWILTAEDGKPLINLSGIIYENGFFLLERTDDNSVLSVVADLIYTNALENGGEVLILKDSNGTEMQRIDAMDGWPTGDNSTKQTMQWDGINWITASPTPGIANVNVATYDVAAEESTIIEEDTEIQQIEQISEPALEIIIEPEPELEIIVESEPELEPQPVKIQQEIQREVKEKESAIEQSKPVIAEPTTVVGSEENVKNSVFNINTATQTQAAIAITAIDPNSIWGIGKWLIIILGIGFFAGIGIIFIRRQSFF